MNQQTCRDILARMTLEEKASLMSGLDNWQTKPVPSQDVPSVWLSDGPHGLRKEDPAHAKENGGSSVRATCFPTAATLACSWDEDLARQVGDAIAQECRAHGVSVLLGPGVNIQRSPLCGRNFEYYSEDPLLAGKMGAGFIRGVEGQGVGASLKHFAVNNQETLRMSIDAEVDERALHEVYLKPFEIAVKEGKPGTVMCSYNRVNGTYASENKTLLTDILRKEWGFEGLVMSDWGAVYRRAAGVAAGLDLEMPYSGGQTDRDVAQAVREGRLREEALDACVLRVLELVAKYAPGELVPFDQKAHHALAVQACARSAVLLKNDGILPLPPRENIAVVGALGGPNCRYQGCGSSIINPFEKVGFTQAMAQEGAAYINYALGYSIDSDAIDAALEAQAVAYARTAKTVVYFMGLTDIFESEGYDRQHLELPQNQTHLLDKLVAANPNVVVVLAGGSPVVTPWAGKVRALLYTALGGEGLGQATYDLLFGRTAPAGKLAQTWPLALADTPCARWYPMGPKVVTYNESIYVGYRYYDKACKEVAFPFGHGLTYTTFAYHDLKAIAAEDGVTVTFALENTGSRDGEEIVQVYAGCPGSAVHRPLRVLGAFARVAVAAGERRTVTLHVPASALAVYSPQQHRFVSEAEDYTLWVGPSSRELPLQATVTLAGETLTPPVVQRPDGPYGAFCDNAFPNEGFYAVNSRPPQDNTKPQPGSYTMMTTLGQMQASRVARCVTKIAHREGMKHLHFSTNPQVNRKVCHCMVRDLPFKNVELNAGGSIHRDTALALLNACNGKGGAVRVLCTLLPKREAKDAEPCETKKSEP